MLNDYPIIWPISEMLNAYHLLIGWLQPMIFERKEDSLPMNSQELQGKLRKLESLLNQQGKIGGAERSAVIRLLGQVRQLKGDKQKLEAENQRLSHQLNRLINKLGSE